MDYNDFILNEDTVELVRALDEGVFFGKPPVCSLEVGWGYRVEYYRGDEVPPLSLKDYAYSAIPKCYAQLNMNSQVSKGIRSFTKTGKAGDLAACQVSGPVNLASLEQSGITALQNLRTLDLRGRGVLVAVIDSGIRYQDEAFRDSDGQTRIVAMWDQAAKAKEDAKETGNAVESGSKAVSEQADRLQASASQGILYGREYGKDEINCSLLAGENLEENGNPDFVQEADTDGHGTALASIMAGSADSITGFTGAAPEAKLIVVKLRQAKQYLRDFFYVPDENVVYSEADILAALHYVNQKALEMGLPLVICLGIGSSSGGRMGTGVLDDCINQLAALRNRVVVCAVGNTANERKHFLGKTESMLAPVYAEINVEKDADGLVAELWASAPERFSVEVASPTGQMLSRVISYSDAEQETDFVFEGTRLSVFYRDVYRFGQNLLIFFRFTNLVSGLWTIRVYPDVSVYGDFNIWLPMEELSSAKAAFLTPDPQTTLVTPSDSYVPISVGGYDTQSGAMYLDSGRGYNANGGVRPDFVAPAVKLTARGLRDNYVTVTGTSGAAALTAGACAQLLEWAATKGNMPDVNSVDVKNLLIRGCNRQDNYAYPSPELGYGKLEAWQALENLRKS